MLKEYEINSNTLIIIPISKKVSKVIEINEEFMINKNSTEIIDIIIAYQRSNFFKSEIRFNQKSACMIKTHIY